MGVSVGLEMAAFMLLFGTTALHYRILGGVLLAAGIVPWFLPVLREAIAKERQRDTRDATSQDVSGSEESRGRRTRG
jgi:glucokinase